MWTILRVSNSPWVAFGMAALLSGACSGGAGNVVKGGDAGADTSTKAGIGCATNAECASKVPTTTPANCAVGTCNALQGVCVFAAKDEDGDGHHAANCTAANGVAIVTGDDCDDHDKNLYPGHPEACSTVKGSTSACSPGQVQCLADGSESACQCVIDRGCCAEQPEACGPDGQWHSTGSACTGDCVGGKCLPCTPGSTQCDASGEPQSCDASGNWKTMACSSGQVCSGSSTACKSGCSIDGVYYAKGAVEAKSGTCQSCDPATSTTAWTNAADGTSCGNGEVCGGGQCGTQCDIGGVIAASGRNNPANACENCQPGVSTTVWTSLPDGTSCGSGEVCNGGSCVAGCLIGGAFYAEAAPNPVNSCQDCEPVESVVDWTSAADGASCGNGQVCSSGRCGAQCDIAGTIVASGNGNPANACQSCEPGASTSAWSSLADGTSCGSGEVCAEGSCNSGCFIVGVYYASAAPNPSNPCQSCAPGTSTTGWTSVSDGTSCGANTCCSGACVNEQTDLNHCGACGNACTDGTSPACTGLRCQYTLASYLSYGGELAVDETSVYWNAATLVNGMSAGGVLEKVSTRGGTVTTLASGPNGCGNFALNSTSVYCLVAMFADGGIPSFSILKTSIDGGTSSTLTSIQNVLPEAIAVDAANVYWTSSGAAGLNSVARVPIGGGTPVTLAESNAPEGIAVAGVNVFWTDLEGLVMTVPISGGHATTLASDEAATPGSIAVDGTNVYWTNLSAGTLMKLPVGGGTATTLLSNDTPSNELELEDIAVDATSVYWAYGGAIVKAPIAGGTATTLATLASGSPGSIAVDATSLYWINGGGSGTLMKTPK